MSVYRFNLEAPVRSALIDRLTLMVSLRWLQWFQNVSNRYNRRADIDFAYDPAAVPAGTPATAVFTFPGAGLTARDIVAGVSFDPMTEASVVTPYMRVSGNVIDADTIAITFLNVGAGAIDLDAGTLRIQVERAT